MLTLSKVSILLNKFRKTYVPKNMFSTERKNYDQKKYQNHKVTVDYVPSDIKLFFKLKALILADLHKFTSRLKPAVKRGAG